MHNQTEKMNLQSENLDKFPEDFTFKKINEDYKNNVMIMKECSKLRKLVLEKYEAAVKNGEDSFVFDCKEYTQTAVEIVVNEMLKRGFPIAIPKLGNYGHIRIYQIYEFDINVESKYYYVPLTNIVRKCMHEYDFPFPKQQN